MILEIEKFMYCAIFIQYSFQNKNAPKFKRDQK